MVHDRCICQASAIRMNADPIDAIPFFSQHWAVISCLWCTFCIASYFDSPIFEWKKQKSILGKLSAEIVGDYARLKAALLQEFKLSANAYLEHVHFIVSILFRLCFVRACVCDCMCVWLHVCVSYSYLCSFGVIMEAEAGMTIQSVLRPHADKKYAKTCYFLSVPYRRNNGK